MKGIVTPQSYARGVVVTTAMHANAVAVAEVEYQASAYDVLARSGDVVSSVEAHDSHLDLSLVRSGPYRLVPHPNYVAVVVEGVALPLVHASWITALVFTLTNAALLTVRLRAENAALATLPAAEVGQHA